MTKKPIDITVLEAAALAEILGAGSARYANALGEDRLRKAVEIADASMRELLLRPGFEADAERISEISNRVVGCMRRNGMQEPDRTRMVRIVTASTVDEKTGERQVGVFTDEDEAKQYAASNVGHEQRTASVTTWLVEGDSFGAVCRRCVTLGAEAVECYGYDDCDGITHLVKRSFLLPDGGWQDQQE